MAASQVFTANAWDRFLGKACWKIPRYPVDEGQFPACVFSSDCTSRLLLTGKAMMSLTSRTTTPPAIIFLANRSGHNLHEQKSGWRTGKERSWPDGKNPVDLQPERVMFWTVRGCAVTQKKLLGCVTLSSQMQPEKCSALHAWE